MNTELVCVQSTETLPACHQTSRRLSSFSSSDCFWSSSSLKVRADPQHRQEAASSEELAGAGLTESFQKEELAC